jgi:hypothetical protein
LTGAALAVLLLGLGVAASAPADDAQDELQSIDKELRVEMQELRSVLSDLDDAGSAQVLVEFRTMVLPEFAARYAALGRANPGSETGMQAWVNLIQLSGRGYEGELFDEALGALASDFIEAEQLGVVVPAIRYGTPASSQEQAVEALGTIADKSPHRSVQAAALLAVAAVLGEDREVGDPRVERAKKALDRLASFEDVEYREGQNYVEAAASLRFALDNLLVGAKCPDFEATDAEGVDFKLSDYEGRVVLVDFWGFW